METEPQLNRAERKRKNTKDKIMRSGRVVFKDKGYHATAVADIMEHADLGHGTFYQYFQNKKDLFLTMLHDIEERIEEKSKLKISKDERNIEQRVYIGIKSVMQVYYEYKDLLSIIRESMSLDEDFRSVGERIQRIFTEKAVRDYYWCDKRGLCHDVNLEVASLCIVSMLQGAGDQIIFNEVTEDEVDFIARNMSKFIYYGLFKAEYIPESEMI